MGSHPRLFKTMALGLGWTSGPRDPSCSREGWEGSLSLRQLALSQCVLAPDTHWAGSRGRPAVASGANVPARCGQPPKLLPPRVPARVQVAQGKRLFLFLCPSELQGGPRTRLGTHGLRGGSGPRLGRSRHK